MLRTLYYGFLVGLYISTGLLASQVLLPSPAFGQLPLWLGLLVVTSLVLLEGRGREAAGPSKKRQIISSVVSAVIPFAVYGFYLATGYASFIGQYGAANFFLLWLIYVLLVALPIALLTRHVVLEGSRSLAYMLTAAAAGLFLHIHAATAIPLHWLAVLTAVGTIGLPFIKTTAPRPTRTKTEPKSVKEKTSRKKKKGTRKSREEGMRRGEHTFHPAYAYITAFLVFVIYPVWILSHLQKALQYLATHHAVYGLLVPAVLAAVATGLYFSGRFVPERRLFAALGGLGVFLAAIIIGMYRWQYALFPDLYMAYYNGQSVTVFLVEWLFWTAVIPSVASGFLFGLIRNNLTVNKNTTRATDLALFLIIWLLFLPGIINADTVHLLFIITGLYISLFVLWIIGKHSNYKLPLRIPLTVAVGAALVVLTANLPKPGFESLFDPSSFKIIYDDDGPGGRTTLLQSRNYDDPFYTTFWNQSTALAQNSNDAKPDLNRVTHLPMLLHPNPGRILMLGTGSFEEMKVFDLYEPGSVTVVEQNPAQITAYTSWLEHREVERPDYLAFHAERLPAFAARNEDTYDLIISAEPFATPYRLPGIFSVPYYEDLRRAIGDDGIFVQWLPLDAMTDGTLASVAAAINVAFPHTRIWTGSMNEGSSMAALIGTNKPLDISGRFHSKLAAITENPQREFELSRLGMPSWEYLAAEYGGDARVVESIAGDAQPLHALDSRPHYIDSPELAGMGMEFLRLLDKRRYDPALTEETDDSVRAVVETLFNSRPRVYRAAMQLRAANDTAAARTLVNIVQQQPFNLEAKFAFANGLVRQAAELVAAGRYAAAQPMLLQATSISPLTTYMLRLLMIASYQIGDTETAQTSLNGIKRLNPEHAGVKDNEATMKAQKGLVQDALLLYENAITLDPTNEEFYANMASLQFNDGRPWEAVRILDNAIKKSYYPAKAYLLQGMIYGEGGKIELALEAYDKYFHIAKPNDPGRERAEENVEKLENESPF